MGEVHLAVRKLPCFLTAAPGALDFAPTSRQGAFCFATLALTVPQPVKTPYKESGKTLDDVGRVSSWR
jgi:hypothetical protein